MTHGPTLNFASVHRVSAAWRWLIAISVPALVALMIWAIREALLNLLVRETETQWWAGVLALALCGGLTLTLLAALIWAFRGRITIDGDKLVVRGAFRSTTITPDRIRDFRHFNNQLYIYLTDKSWAVTIGGFENQWLIYRWLSQRGTNIDDELRAREDEVFNRDQTLGMTEAERNQRLAKLHRIVRLGNRIVYAAAGAGFVNFLFFELKMIEIVAVGTLIIVPLLFDMLALANRGHVHVDHDDGSRYPQILTGTLVAGCVLALLSLLDRGALLEPGFYEIFAAALIIKGFIWYAIDPQRIATLRRRGATVFAISLVGIYLLPAFWVGGSVYQLNKLLDSSAIVWHETEIVDKKVSSGRTTSYSVAVAAWADGIEDPVEISLRRAEFDRLESGQRVTVGIREGAFGIAWVAELAARSP
jgi:hypothetical protein